MVNWLVGIVFLCFSFFFFLDMEMGMEIGWTNCRPDWKGKRKRQRLKAYVLYTLPRNLVGIDQLPEVGMYVGR